MMRFLKLPTLLLCIGLLAGCNQPTFRLTKNEHDLTVRLASNRLDGKRQKTKQVKSLETSFAEASAFDLHLVDSLKTLDTPDAWEKIHAIHKRMVKRQERIEPLLPLVSDDGYRPVIKLLPVREMAAESRQEVIDRYLVEIRQNMALAEAGQRLKARLAYDRTIHLQKNYDWDDAISNSLIDKALTNGQVFILFETNNQSGFDGSTVQRRLDFLGVSGNSPWQVIHYAQQNGVDYDFKVETNLLSSWVSFENISRSSRTVTETIQIGQEAITDTSGNVTYKPIMGEISATITDITAHKEANLTAEFIVYDFKTGQIARSEHIYINHVFEDTFCTYSGDSRVSVCSSCSASEFVSFPSDWQMMDNCADNLKHRLDWLLPSVDLEN